MLCMRSVLGKLAMTYHHCKEKSQQVQDQISPIGQVRRIDEGVGYKWQ